MVAQNETSSALSQKLVTVLKRRYTVLFSRSKQFMTKAIFAFKPAIFIQCLAKSIIAKEILDTTLKQTLALKRGRFTSYIELSGQQQSPLDLQTLATSTWARSLVCCEWPGQMSLHGGPPTTRW